MIEQKANGDITIELGNDGKPNKTQRLMLLKNGVLQRVVTVDEISAFLTQTSGYTGDVVIVDIAGTHTLSYVDGLLTEVQLVP